MATKKPRVTVTLEPEVYETYRVFAEAQGMRVSQCMAGLLSEVEPSLRKTTALLLAAQAAPKETLESIRGTFEGFAKQVDDATGGAQQALDLALKRGQ